MIPPHLLHQTKRYEELSRLRAYYRSEQYKGRPDFWTGLTANSAVVPLRERAPCVVYPLAKIATNRIATFTFGTSQFPKIQVDSAEDSDDVGSAITDANATDLEKAIESIIKTCHVRARISDAMQIALSQRTVAILFSIKKGKIDIQNVSSADCIPEFIDDDPSLGVKRLVWCYQYQKNVVENGAITSKAFWFRRDYDENYVVVYTDIPVEPGKDPEWQIDTEKTKAHNFGFCPVLWVRNCPESSSSVDGVSIYDGLLNELDALNFALSQRHRGITFFGTPQPYETGVDQSDGPGAKGRTSSRGYSPDDKSTSPFGASAQDSDAARKMAPDYIWSYEGTDVNVSLLETTGKAFEVATLHVDDIRSRLSEAMSVILAGPQDALSDGVGGLNAKLLAMLYAPMLAYVDNIRDTVWWPEGLLAVISMCLRIIEAVNGEGVYIKGIKKALPVLKSFRVEVEDGSTVWMVPQLEPLWGDNFSPSNEEIAQGTTAAAAAVTSGLISKESGTRFVAPYFGISSVEDETDKLETEIEDNAVSEVDKLKETTQIQTEAQASLIKAKAKGTQ